MQLALLLLQLLAPQLQKVLQSEDILLRAESLPQKTNRLKLEVVLAVSVMQLESALELL